MDFKDTRKSERAGRARDSEVSRAISGHVVLDSKLSSFSSPEADF